MFTTAHTKSTFANSQCEKGFKDKAGTVFHSQHTPLKIWFLLAMYLYFILSSGCSIVREASFDVVLIPFPRCYRFIRIIIEKLLLSSLSSSTTKLNGPATKSDEFYIKKGL